MSYKRQPDLNAAPLKKKYSSRSILFIFFFLSIPVNGYSQEPALVAQGEIIQSVQVSRNAESIIEPSSSSLANTKEEAITFQDLNSYIIIDYAQPTLIRAVSLRSDSNDVYLLRYSMDGRLWENMAFVPENKNANGLNTTNIPLYSPVTLRYIAVSPASGDGVYSISNFSAYEKIPGSWTKSPFHKLGTLSPVEIRDILIVLFLLVIPVLALFFIMKIPREIQLGDRAGIILILLIIIIGAAGFFIQSQLVYYKVYRYVIKASLMGLALVVMCFLQRQKIKKVMDSRSMVKQKILIVTLFFVSLATYFNYGSFFGDGKGFVHHYDFSAYYLGSKYFPELGQHDLYVGFLAATREGPNPPTIKVIRELRSNEPIQVTKIENEIQAIHQKFSHERWEEFKKDCVFFQFHFGDNLEDFLQDHGYNPSPVWTMVGHYLTNLLSDFGLGTEQAVNLLSSLDILLLLGIFILIHYAFGFSALLYCFVFWCLNPFDIFNYLSGAFFRQSWLFSTIASMCFFKREKHILAGIFMAHAIGERLFPVAFILFPLLQSIYSWITKKTIPGHLLKFGTSTAMTLLILFVVSSAAVGGTKKWDDFYKNIQAHNEGIYTNHISFRNMYLLEYKKAKIDYGGVDTFWRIEKERRFKYYHTTINFLAVLLCVLFLYAFRKLSALKGMQLSCFLPFLLFYPANYYYSFFMLLILYLLDEAPQYMRGFFTLLMVGSLARIFIKQDDLFYPYLSYLLLVMFVWFVAEKLAGENLVLKKTALSHRVSL